MPDSTLVAESGDESPEAARRLVFGVGLTPQRDDRPSHKPRVSEIDPRTESQRDVDRITYSPSWRRLGGVTQVVTPFGDGSAIHNRLTHSEKVAQVARSVAQRILADEDNHNSLTRLGGLDLFVCEAAALAHDLGHPPFGHIGEETLDRIARTPVKEGGLGLEDGFEGNAQTFRIVTTGKNRSLTYEGLDLTYATLAGIAKYPWSRGARAFAEDEHEERLRKDGEYRRHWNKFNVYMAQQSLLRDARSFLPDIIGPETQSLEASVMDVADDISYAIHDLEDFYLAGTLDIAAVLDDIDELREKMHDTDAMAQDNAFLKLSRRLAIDYADYYNAEMMKLACSRVAAELKDGFSVPVNRSRFREADARSKGSDMIGTYIEAVVLKEAPLWEHGPHVGLKREVWHEVQLLKAITKAYVIERPDFALLQRGQQNLLTDLIGLLVAWADDASDRRRLPRSLREELEISEEQDRARASDKSTGAATYEDIVGYGRDENAPRGGSKRVILDYICTLNDQQCAALFLKLSGAVMHRVAESFT